MIRRLVGKPFPLWLAVLHQLANLGHNLDIKWNQILYMRQVKKEAHEYVANVHMVKHGLGCVSVQVRATGRHRAIIPPKSKCLSPLY